MAIELEPERFVRVKIEGLEEYFVSNWHRVFSLKSGKLIKPYLHKSRSSYYWRFCLGNKKIMGHVLVAIHFKKKNNPKQNQVEHLDNNTLNNNAGNLIWATQSENQKFRYKKAAVPEWLLDLFHSKKAAHDEPPLTQNPQLPIRQKME